jgi:hypothetical protein
MSVRPGARDRDDDWHHPVKTRRLDHPDDASAAPNEPLLLPHRHNLLPKLVLCCCVWWAVLSCGALVLVVASAFGRNVDLVDLVSSAKQGAPRACAASFRLAGTRVTPAHVRVAVLHALENTATESARAAAGSFDDVPLSLVVTGSLVRLSVEPCDQATSSQLASDQFVFEMGVFLARLRPDASVSRA